MKFRLEQKRQQKIKPPSKLMVTLAPWRFQIIIGTLLLSLLGGLLTAIWYGSRIEQLQLKEIVVIGGPTISHEEMTAAAREVLTGSYYRLIPHSFAPLYPEKALYRRLLSIPRVKQVVLSVDGQTLTIGFDEYIPEALWCVDQDNDECLFLDQQGYAFATAPALVGNALVRYLSPQQTPTVRTEGFSPVYMDETLRFITTLENEFNLYVIRVIKQDDVDTLYITAGGGEIKVSNRQALSETLNNLRVIVNSEDFPAILADTFFSLDLRFGDKVFVQAIAPSATSSASSTPAE